jgi:hypothetical protein
MQLKLLDFFKKYIFAILLVLVTSFLLWQNFKPGTWLTGWDTLHPEFDFLLNLKRVIFGVWRSEQGLGALASHAHMVEIPRIIFLWFSSLILPTYFLRFFYFALMLILGPLGMYFFIKNTSEKLDLKIPAFFGGLFYVLNLGTMQHFYIPFEMFATLYAFLPWLFLWAFKFMKSGQKKNLVIFSLITILSAPMAYAPVLWYAYFACLVIYLTGLYFHKIRNLKRLFVIILITLLINSYWLLPNIYSVIGSDNLIPEAKINQLFSDRAFEHDKKYANPGNAILLEGFLFDWQEYQSGKFVNLLAAWQTHLKNPVVLASGWILFLFIPFGLIASMIKKEKFSYIVFPVFIFSGLFLIYGIWPLSNIFLYFRDHFSSIFREALRFPWTKFSIFVIFCYSYYFSKGIEIIWGKFKYLIFIIPVFFVIWMLPAFRGYFISSTRQTSIPKEYSEVFNWFKTQPFNEKIGLFPVPNFWGWDYYQWGFEGAGFIWFGLPQSVLVRDFDRWDPANENYYWEISYASYSKNLDLFEKVLEKYQVNWLLVDENLINPSFVKALYTDELERMLSESKKINLVRKIGRLKIYKVNLSTPIKDNIFLANDLPVISPKYQWGNFDQGYQENGNYIENSVSNFKPRILYPFRELFTGKKQSDLNFKIEEDNTNFILTKTFSESIEDYNLVLPSFGQSELTWSEVGLDGSVKTYNLNVQVSLENKTIKIIFPKINIYHKSGSEIIRDKAASELINCNGFQIGRVFYETHKENSKEYLRLKSSDAIGCSLAFWLPNLSHQAGYLVSVESRHLSGEAALFWLENLTVKKADIETYVSRYSEFENDYFIQPPMAVDGLGYGFHIDNSSFGLDETVNDIGMISVNPFPYLYLSQVKLVEKDYTGVSPTYNKNFEVLSANRFYYTVKINNLDRSDNQPTLVLSQSYNSGWYLFGAGSETEHVLVNNWANGWVLPKTNDQSPKTIYIIFLPQLLEFLGFFLSIFALVLILRSKQS